MQIVQATLGEVLSIAGRQFVSPKGFTVLQGGWNVNTNFSFRAPNGTAGYTPAAAKSFYPLALILTVLGATSIYAKLARSDNDVGIDTATALTNPIYVGGSGSTTGFVGIGNARTEHLIQPDPAAPNAFSIANTKFMSVSGNAGTITVVATLIGIEK